MILILGFLEFLCENNFGIRGVMIEGGELILGLLLGFCFVLVVMFS